MNGVLTGAAAAQAASRFADRPRRGSFLEGSGFPPIDAVRVLVHGTVVAPVAPVAPVLTVTTEVLAYRVKLGHVFVLTDVVLNYVGAGFQPGLGDIVWVIDRNTPAGSLSPVSLRVKGFEGLDFPVGTTQFPWTLTPPEIFQPGDVIRSRVITTSAIPVGSPNVFISVFKGWLVPAFELE